jgi:hypothetical protein
MGCAQATETPTLICFYEQGNNEQKDYCIKLKDNFKYEKTIKFEIKSVPQVNFSVKFKVNGRLHVIQTEYNNSETVMNESLEKIYNLLK